MVVEEKLENLKFDHTINLINKKRSPEQFPMHWHKYVEIIAVPDHEPEAKATIIVNNKRYHLTNGDILFIWPGELHEIAGNKNKQIVFMQFNITTISGIYDFSLYLNTYRRKHLITYKEHPGLMNQLMEKIHKMLILQGETKPFVKVENLILLYEMFITLGTYLNEHGEGYHYTGTKQDKTIEKMQLACSYIQENCENDLSLDEVANHIGFSPCYFSRCFKKVTTYSFVQYLTLQRVKKVQTLLMDTSLTVTDVAYQAGFRSLSTFNRVFHAFNGCSPSDYKNYYSVEYM